MAPLQQELSSLEVEPLQTVENAPASEEVSSLYGVTASSENLEVDAIVIGALSITNDFAGCCCCCCPACCC